jgi:hypothetical protein
MKNNGPTAARPADREATGCDARPPDPWALVWGQPYIDAARLAAAIEFDLEHNSRPDFRTRLLVRDAARALRSFWGKRRFDPWLATSPVGARIRAILDEHLGAPGFPYIRRRLVANNAAIQLGQILELLGRNVHERLEVNIAGSIPTLVKGLTARPTTDIDFVNEVPEPIRRQRATLQQIQNSYGLTLGHVQSHYLPANWVTRRHFLGDYGGLRVYLVDEYDIFVSKLSSKQEKHKDDLRVLAGQLDKETARRRLLHDGRAFLDDPYLRPQIEENWRFIYQEPLRLPPAEAAAAPDAGEVGRQRSKPAARKRGKGQGRKRKPPEA